jgi:hypothetical protein
MLPTEINVFVRIDCGRVIGLCQVPFEETAETPMTTSAYLDLFWTLDSPFLVIISTSLCLLCSTLISKTRL